MHGRRTTLVAAVGAGLIAGVLSSLGRAHLDGTLDAFANSISTWLVAPFVIGMLAPSRRGAAVAGLVTCASQIAGYYLVDYLQGVRTAGSLIAFWTACAVIGGPVFGSAGQVWQAAAPRLKGLGMAALASVFVAEGLYAFGHQQHRYHASALWVALGAGLAFLAARERVAHLRWLGLTVPLGLSGEVALTAVLQRFF
jgi:hypothetical protein